MDILELSSFLGTAMKDGKLVVYLNSNDIHFEEDVVWIQQAFPDLVFVSHGLD